MLHIVLWPFVTSTAHLQWDPEPSCTHRNGPSLGFRVKHFPYDPLFMPCFYLERKERMVGWSTPFWIPGNNREKELYVKRKDLQNIPMHSNRRVTLRICGAHFWPTADFVTPWNMHSPWLVCSIFQYCTPQSPWSAFLLWWRISFSEEIIHDSVITAMLHFLE